LSELKLNIACFSEAGVKPNNEDAAGYFVPSESYTLLSKGVALAVADGVSTAEAGREASHTTIERFLEEYFKTPDTWSVSKSGEKILSTVNLRLFRKSHDFVSDTKGFLCTFSAVVVKGHYAHFFHVGDSRVYLFRGGQLTQLTEDHTAVMDDNRAVLSRAMGMDSQLNVDYGKAQLVEGDRLLITSDGVHDFVDHKQLTALFAPGAPVEEVLSSIKNTAMDHRSDDNLSAIVAEVVSLHAENIEDYSAQLTQLPFPPELEPGMQLDGYCVQKELFASSRSQLYLVKDGQNDTCYIMKTPSRNFEDDVNYIDRFVQEEWIGSRIQSEYVVKIIPQQRKRSALYYLMEYVEGEGLDKWIEQHQPPSPRQTITLIKQIAKGMQAFHDNEAVHQDLKPANVMIKPDGKIKIVDFGSVYVAGLAERHRPIMHEGALGTASYSDPHYLMGKNPGIQGDVYSLATIVYEMFTGHLPYGSKVSECRTAFDYDHLRYRHAYGFNAMIPEWFDRSIETGVSFDLERRYASVDALMYDLTHPNPEFLKTDPIIEKNTNSLLFWKLLSGFWFVTFVLVMYLFSTIE